MKRLRWDRVMEPSHGLVHFTGVGAMDAATLCGKTDWLNREHWRDGDETDDPVTCLACLDLLRSIKARGWPEEIR